MSTERLTTFLAFQDITSTLHKAVVLQTEIAHEVSIELVRSAIPGFNSREKSGKSHRSVSHASLSAPSATMKARSFWYDRE
jgi:hypothetical protein